MRSQRTLCLILFLTALMMSACKDIGDPVSSTPPVRNSPDSYNYRAYDSKGVLVVSGLMTLAFSDSGTIHGTWSLQNVAQGEDVGPQTGNGTLTGSVTGTLVSINLNPGWVDNNIFLAGSLGTDRLIGTWMWSTFVGPTSRGTFEALKSK